MLSAIKPNIHFCVNIPFLKMVWIRRRLKKNQSKTFSSCKFTKTLSFFTLNTSIPLSLQHDKWKEVSCLRRDNSNEMISTSQLWNVARFKKRLTTEFIYHSWYNITGLVFKIIINWTEGCCSQEIYPTMCF